MSYKPIDLQTSLPRTVEMAPLQQQQQQRAAMEQAALGQQAVKQAEKQAQSNTKLESANQRSISERDPREPRKPDAKRKRRQGEDGEPDEEEKSAHPYKGKHIDITL